LATAVSGTPDAVSGTPDVVSGGPDASATPCAQFRDDGAGTPVALLLGVSRARPIYAGDTLLVTRRVSRRMLLLRPGERVNQIIGYLLAVLSQKYGILIHAVCALSNHAHQASSDPDGRIADFTRDFHSLVARHINAVFGDFENLWSTEQTSLVRLAEAGDIVDKIAYTMANPVSSFLVMYGRSWPGLRLAWSAGAKPKVFRRPVGFLRPNTGRWPESATLELARPPGHDELSDDELSALLAEAIEAKEEEARQEAAAENIRFLGRRTVRRQRRHSRPKTHEPRFGISPRHACKNKWLRIERLLADRAWLDEYNRCYDLWRSGDYGVVFPHGTYQLRVQHGARVARPPD
jgi:putative transposase